MVGKHIIIKGKIETIKTLEDGRWCEMALYCGDEHGKKSSPPLCLVGAGMVWGRYNRGILCEKRQFEKKDKYSSYPHRLAPGFHQSNVLLIFSL